MKKTYSQKQHKYQKYISKNYSWVARVNEFTVWPWFQSMIMWYHQISSMTNIEFKGIFWWCRILWIWVLCIIRKAYRDLVFLLDILKIWLHKIIAWTFQQSIKITKWKVRKAWSDIHNIFFWWYKTLWNLAVIQVCANI